MQKILGLGDIEGRLLLRDEEVGIKDNIFKWWPKSKVEQVKEDVENGVKISLFDRRTNKETETTMKWVAADDGFISNGTYKAKDIWLEMRL